MIKFLKWLIWVLEGNAPSYYRYRWQTFLSQLQYQWKPMMMRKLGLLEIRTAPNLIKLMESRFGLSYRLESAKELVALKDEKKRQARIKNAEEYEMTHCSKRSYGYNKNWFHRSDPSMGVGSFMEKQKRITGSVRS